MQDQQLLSEYRETRSEPAFAELVRRYADVVYAAARRQVKVPAMAEDVAQAVFLLLSQKAGRVGRAELLAGWLVRAAWFTSRRAMTAERRREYHEREAAAMRTEATEPAWESYSEEIDAAMAKLGAAERSAVTLRYFCGLSLREVGEQMSLSEEAARKRVDRGLEKLRTLLSKKVVVPSAAGLAVAMAANGAEAAPASVLAVASAQPSVSVVALAKGVGKMMAWAKVKVAATIALLAIVLAIGGAVVIVRQGLAQAVAESPAKAADVAPSLPATRAALPVWFDFMPFSPVRTLAADRSFIYEGRRPAIGSREAVSASLEIRDASNQKRIAEVPDAVGIPKDSGYSGGAFLTRDQIRRIGPLPDGEYLVALTFGDHVRCSNVAALKIDARYQPEQEPTLRLVPVPLSPGERLPSVWLVATGPKVSDAKFNNEAIAFPTLIINGVEHNPKIEKWAGPVGPIQPGGQDIRLIRLDNYTPDVAPEAQHRVKARVLDYVSAEVTIPSDDLPGAAWDKATATLRAVSLPAAILRGTVIGPDGKPATGYEVHLQKPDGASLQENCDERGSYRFANVPPGDYAMYVNPPGRGQPQLSIERISLHAGMPLIQDFTLAAKFKISGRVSYRGNSPAAGKDVSITARSDDGRIEYENSATTDARGHYVIGLPFEEISYLGLNGTAADGPLPDPTHDVKASAGPVDMVIPQGPPAEMKK